MWLTRGKWAKTRQSSPKIDKKHKMGKNLLKITKIGKITWKSTQKNGGNFRKGNPCNHFDPGTRSGSRVLALVLICSSGSPNA